MSNFVDEYGMEHDHSSLYNPQTNFQREGSVKVVKELLMKTYNDINSKQFFDGIA